MSNWIYSWERTRSVGKSVGGWLPFEIAACSTEIPMTHLFPVISETYGFQPEEGSGLSLTAMD